MSRTRKRLAAILKDLFVAGEMPTLLELFGGNDITFFDDVLDVFGAAFGEFRDVDEAVFTKGTPP